MLITQTYLGWDVIQDLNDYPSEIILVVADNKPELMEMVNHTLIIKNNEKGGCSRPR